MVKDHLNNERKPAVKGYSLCFFTDRNSALDRIIVQQAHQVKSKWCSTTELHLTPDSEEIWT